METIEVERGLLIAIKFTFFDVEESGESSCWDYVTITDGDGTSLLGVNCGTGIPRARTSITNTVRVAFHTNGRIVRSGWRLEWTPVTPIGGDGGN